MAYGDRGAWERSPAAVAWPAMLAAGPLFTTATALASLYAELPAPVVIEPSTVFGFLFLQIPALVVGAVLALVPTLVGTGAMQALSRSCSWARSGAAWVLAGAALGVLIAAVFDAIGTPPVAFGLVATSAGCAGLCHWRARGGGEGDWHVLAEDGSRGAARPAMPRA